MPHAPSEPKATLNKPKNETKMPPTLISILYISNVLNLGGGLGVGPSLTHPELEISKRQMPLSVRQITQQM